MIDGHLERLTMPNLGDNRASHLPDGTLLFASTRSGRSQIWSMDPGGGPACRVHESTANDHGRVAPNAGGTRLCFSSDRSGESAIYVLDRSTGRVALVSDPGFWSFGPSWSSRDLIAFFSTKGGNKLNIWTARPDGSEARQITDVPGETRQPWWSPGGETLAISGDDATGVFQLRLMTPDGTGPRTITSGGTYQQPCWSPDGRWLAVSARRDEPHFRIYVMNAVTGDELRAIRQPEVADNVHPAWAPDGRSIVFTGGSGGTGALWRFVFA